MLDRPLTGRNPPGRAGEIRRAVPGRPLGSRHRRSHHSARLAGHNDAADRAGPTIPAGISTRQVAYLQPLHPDRHRVRVVGIVLLGDQHGIDGLAYPVIGPARTYQPPQILLVVRLADDFQIVTAVEQRNLDAIPYPDRSFVPAGCYWSSWLVQVSLRSWQ